MLNPSNGHAKQKFARVQIFLFGHAANVTAKVRPSHPVSPKLYVAEKNDNNQSISLWRDNLCMLKQEILEGINRLLPLKQHGERRKRCVQQFF
jgi:hypothetical protein